MSRSFLLTLSVVVFLSTGCSSNVDDGIPPTMKAINEIEEMKRVETREAAGAAAAEYTNYADIKRVGTFQVEFITTVGRFVVQVHRDWSPVGADRFYRLVEDEFFDDCAFFRVLPNFMAQFGLPADPSRNAKWAERLPDDPPNKSNTRGTITFATSGPGSRTTQLFINFVDNGRLDSDGFTPFGKVIEGMDVVDQISSVHGETPDQTSIKQSGNAYLSRNFPDLTYIQTARLVEPTE